MSNTSRQKKAFAKWMQEHNVRASCSACGSESGRNMHESILGGLDLDLKNRQAKPSSFGYLAVVCKRCQYTMLFAAAPILGK
jgi:predicted nucleic-acid-binding Zn-ribbon protein